MLAKMPKLLVIGLAGAAGSISRHLLGGWMHRLVGLQFPSGTLFVNGLGCLLIGFLGTLADEKGMLASHHYRAAIFLGFLGAFTTFSTFTYETWLLFKNNAYLFAGLNIFASLLICFLGLFLGIFLARLL